MADRDMWKMLHLLHLYGKSGISREALVKAGIDCIPDTIDPLLESGAVVRLEEGHYRLSPAARTLLGVCVVANKARQGKDLRVDYPQAFVVMPFSEKWSKAVYNKMIKPAVRAAGLECVRADKVVMSGKIDTGIWNQLLRAGVVVAEVSSPNVNVFYELGLAHALGKDVLLVKQKDTQLPADFGGELYYDYELPRLESGAKILEKALRGWAKEKYAAQVKALSRH
jgi:hypothetical protein